MPEIKDLIITLDPVKLTIKGTIKDISFLKDSPRLSNLNLSHTSVTDLTPLKDMPGLKRLCLL